MKIAIIFAVIGARFCFGDVSVVKCDAPFTGDPSNNRDCTKYAMQHLNNTVAALIIVLCKYIDHKAYMKEQLYEDTKAEIRNLTACTGCTLDQILGFPCTLEDLGLALGAIAGDTLHGFAHLTEFLGISKPVASLACIALRGVLPEECKAKFKKGNAVAEKCAKTMYCEKQKKKPDLLNVVTSLDGVGCVDKGALEMIQSKGRGSEFCVNVLGLRLDSLFDSIFKLLGFALNAALCTVGSIFEALGLSA